MKKLTALFLSLSLLVCSFLFASAAEDSGEDANVTEPASEVFIDNIGSSYESLELESGVDPSAEEEIREAIETFSGENSVKAETTTVGVTTEAWETAEIQEVTTIQEATEPASDRESVSAQEITETRETDSNQEITEAVEPQSEDEVLPIPSSSHLSEEEEVMPVADGDIFDITITWSDMSFTYTPAPKGEWDPDLLDYKQSDKPPTWKNTSDGSGYGKFTVKYNGVPEESIRVSFKYSDYRENDNSLITQMRFSDTAGSFSSAKTYYNLDFYGGDDGVEHDVYVVPEVPKDATADDFGGSGIELGKITITIGSPFGLTASTSSINPAEQPVFE